MKRVTSVDGEGDITANGGGRRGFAHPKQEEE
jgi:hypothetical protein